MKSLVVLCHADPVTRPIYEASIRQRGIEADIVYINRAGFSSVYRQLATEVRGPDGRYLPGLLRRYPPPRPLDSYDVVVGCSFSAGYGMWTTVLTSPEDAKQLAGIVAIDSWHAGLDPDGTARDQDLAVLVGFARRAKDGPTVCWVGHSDVRTYGYASTTQVAQELERLAGGCSGGLRIQGYNLVAGETQEHGLALTRWGDDWLADALLSLQERRAALGVPDHEEPAPDPAVPLGERALALTLEEQQAGVREIPGARHHPRILEYLAGCMRDGRCIGSALRTDETAWCAAGLSWTTHRVALPGEQLPHGYRASVRELWADAMARGTARAVAALRRREYVPQPGDAVILVRGGSRVGAEPYPFRYSEGRGHTGRAISWDASSGAFTTKDGNINNTWTDVPRSLDSPELVGVIAYPRPEAPAVWTPTGEELQVMRRLWGLSDAMMNGQHGLEWSWDQLPMDL